MKTKVIINIFTLACGVLLYANTSKANTVLGSAVGAAVGSAIGQHTGGRDGAVLGGAIGGAVGARIGNDMEMQSEVRYGRGGYHENRRDDRDDDYDHDERHGYFDHHQHYYIERRHYPRGHAWGYWHHRGWEDGRRYAFER